MKEKGFTLLEVLAVIVILAVVALIALPRILNIIENSKKDSAMDSMYGYIDAIRQSYVRNAGEDQSEKYQGKYVDVSKEEIKKEDGTKLSLEIKGIIPNEKSKEEDYVEIGSKGDISRM